MIRSRPTSKRNRPSLTRHRPKLTEARPNPGRIGPHLGRVRPKSSMFGLETPSADFVRIRAELDHELGPIPSNWGHPLRPEGWMGKVGHDMSVNHSGTGRAQALSRSRMWTKRAKIGRHRTQIRPHGGNFGELRTNDGRSAPRLVDSRPTRVEDRACFVAPADGHTCAPSVHPTCRLPCSHCSECDPQWKPNLPPLWGATLPFLREFH